MGRQSSIETLPAKIKAAVDEAIRKKATIDEIVDKIAELGLERSRSAVGRYKKNAEAVYEDLRELREVTTILTENIGPEATESKTGRLLGQLVQKHLFDMVTKAEEGAFDPKAISEMARGLKDLAYARKMDVETEAKIRKDFVDKLDGAVKEAEAAGEKGLSAERIAQLRREFLGVRG